MPSRGFFIINNRGLVKRLSFLNEQVADDCELVLALNYAWRLTYRRNRDDFFQLERRRLAPQSLNSSRETVLGDARHFLELGSVLNMSDDEISDMRDLEHLLSWRRVLQIQSQDQHGRRD